MYAIRITLKNEEQYFIDETKYYSGFYFVDNIKDALIFDSTLEFKVTWKYMNRIIPSETSWGNTWIYKEVDHSFDKQNDVIKFEAIDLKTLNVKEFDVYENEIEITDELYVDTKTFNRLKKCPIESSHWLYDKNDESIPSSKDDDYNRVFKLKYYVRGLTCTARCHDNWNIRNNEKSWHKTYDLHHKCMKHPIIQQLLLLNLDECKPLYIFEEQNEK